VKLELGLKLGTFGIQTMKIDVVHNSTIRFHGPDHNVLPMLRFR
jgi:hypothetical protein